MAHPIASPDDSDSWNPALRPEDTTQGEGGSSDLIAEDDLREQPALSSQTSSTFKATEDLSATDLPPAKEATEPSDTNDSSPEDTFHALDTVGNNNGILNPVTELETHDHPSGFETDGIGAAQPRPEAHLVETQPEHTDASTANNPVEAAAHPASEEHTQPEALSTKKGSSGHDPRGKEASGGNSDEDDFFNQLKPQTKPIFPPPEAESRFEEGIPQLDEAKLSSGERTTQGQNPVDNIFANDDDEAGDFFNSVQESEVAEERTPHVSRKSTSQVINSVGLGIDSPASETSAAAQLDDVLKGAGSESKTEDAPSEEELAARWKAELDEPEDDIAARWQAALDDDDILLEDEATNAPPTDDSQLETPQNYAGTQPAPGVYTPHQPSTADLVHGVSAPGTAPATSYFPQQPRNPITQRAESFAERSKEGYKSPYDLPDDLSRRRRPVVTRKSVPALAGIMAPSPPRDNAPPSRPSAVSAMSNPAVTAAPPTGASSSTAAAPPPSGVPPGSKNFYEELPMPPPKHRPASTGRYTPDNTATTRAPAVSPPKGQHAPVAPPAQANEPSVQSSLQPPEQLDPYTNSLAPSTSVPSAPSRYSPQPPALQPSTKPPSLSRYSPAPPASGPSARNRYASQPLNVPGQATSLPFQPRTSSPLAHHEKVSYHPEDPQQHRRLEPSVNLSPPLTQQGLSVEQDSPRAPHPHQTPPRSRYAPPEYVNEFAKRVAPPSGYVPAAPPVAMQTSPPAGEEPLSPTRRSLTQSPTQHMAGPRLSVPTVGPFQRPASVHGPGSPTKAANPYAPSQPTRRNRSLTQHLQFIAPTDGQEDDPLARWKGAPIFKFGFGGTVVSCFPKHIPRYSAGQTAPMIMPISGEAKVSQLNQCISAADSIVQHPGPLRAKSKKKDLLSWLSSKIAAFENEEVPGFGQLHPDDQRRHEEKVLLWKVIRILVENDGAQEGSPNIQKSLRQAIFPTLQIPDGPGGMTFAPSGGLGITSQPDAADSQWMEELRHNLMLGNREKAVWDAVDRRLWGHAMIIASTSDRSIWKQVVQEFVRREIRSTSANTASLAALYEIFAGNIEESIDELVPPSARAGLQLISKADGSGTTKNALDGLESWRDTLGLVLSNRSAEDHQGLVVLGRLLASYGRTEAAHICFIFSRAAMFGGGDDPQANIVLLGVDHQRFPSGLSDEDAILLTEAYEFATSVLASPPTANLPHLLAFKLLLAKYLADQGRKSEAQNYCEAVAATLKATTRPSPYHHQHLFTEIDELSTRLRQTTGDGGSWISKPSMEKVSGSMWARFNSFVVGDDSDAASTGSGKAGEVAEIGPFANVSGTPPTVSRSPSVSEPYGSYPGSGAQPVPGTGTSRYHPSSQYVPNASPEQNRGRSSLDSPRSASFGLASGQRRNSQEPSPLVDGHYQAGPFYGSPGASGYQSTPPQTSYVPLAPVEEDLTTQPPAESGPQMQAPINGLFYQPPGQDPTMSTQSPYYQGPPGMPQSDAGYMAPAAGNVYEPPAISTDAAAPEETEEPSSEALPRKKSFMDDDDDDDLATRAAAIQKAENDRKADDAFKKAAEEDGKGTSGRQGWFYC